MRRRILMCLAVLLLLSGMGAASASDVLAAHGHGASPITRAEVYWLRGAICPTERWRRASVWMKGSKPF